jgi:hypothetical protein
VAHLGTRIHGKVNRSGDEAQFMGLVMQPQGVFAVTGNNLNYRMQSHADELA